MAKITAYIPEPKETYQPENQRQVLQSLDTVKQQLNTSYQQDLKNEQSTFNWFISWQYKNAGINLNTTDTTTVLTSPSSARLLVKQIQVDNASGSPVNLSVQFTDSSASLTFRIRNKAIPANEVVDIINQTLVLEEGDSLKMTAGTANELQGIISYAQIDRSQENG